MDFLSIMQMTDEQLMAFAAQHQLVLTKKQVKALRPILQSAKFSWLFTGIPEAQRQQIATIIGPAGLQQLERIIQNEIR